MEELYEKIDNLKKALDKTTIIKSIKILNNDILSDEYLLKLIKKYNETLNENTKKEILNNQLYQKYKYQEAELNILILEINNELKKITKKDRCGL